MKSLLDIFAAKINFSYDLIRPPDGYWGAEGPDGVWSGMMGMVHREEVEFALGPFTVTPQRESVSDFTVSVHNDNQAIMLIRPGIQNDLSGFLKPFSLDVWLLTLTAMICISITMALVVWAEGRIFSFTRKNLSSRVSAWVLQTLTHESSHWLPEEDGGRIVVITWLLASLVFMSSYSGILTAMLTLPRVTIPIDSLSDLVAQVKLPWRLEAGSMTPKFLLDSGDPVREKVVTHSSGTFPDCWTARQDIASGKYAAICDETTMKKAMSWDFSTSGRCHLYIAREKVYSASMFAIAFRRNSTYLLIANDIINRVKESGLLTHWLEQQIRNTSRCLRPPAADRTEGIAALNLQAFHGPLLVLSVGKTLVFILRF
ncbi:probable glutamate receptor [Penaeus vannamei]|uniref:probable glutamate receptor n=1 Tax=Penaeus vannamei TaxID=6689 RepID=UPI00387F54EB